MKQAQRFAAFVAPVLIVAVIMGGVVALRSVLVDDRTTRAGQVRSSASISPPPEGMRWVGWGRVVVAVPEWWSTGETQCFAPVEDTVYFDTSAIADCSDAPSAAAVREVSALAVLDATSGYGEQEVRAMRPVSTVDGHEVVERDGCEGWFDRVCRRLFAVPAQGVVFAVTIADEGDGSYQEIRDSVQVLPDTHTVVPLATRDGWTPAWGAEPRVTKDLAAAIENGGLRVEVEKIGASGEATSAGLRADLPTGSLLDVEPPLGSVIEQGGTVTITVMGDDDDS